MKRALLSLIVGVCWIGISMAQSPWLSDTRLTSVSLEWDKPLFDDRTLDRDLVTGISSSLFVTGRFRVSDNFRFVGELPISHFGFESNNPVGDDNSTVIGNVYVGGIWDVNTANPTNHAYIELGVRIPTTPQPNVNDRFGGTTGLLAEVSDRMEAYMWDTWAIPVVGNFVTTVNKPFAVKGRLGTVYDIFTDDLKNSDNSLWLLYGVTALYQASTLEGHLGFSGRNQYVGNISGVNFWDSGFTQLRAGVARPFRNVTPGVYVRMPLGDNHTQVLDFAYGFSLEIRG